MPRINPRGKLKQLQIIKPQAKHYQAFAFLLHLKEWQDSIIFPTQRGSGAVLLCRPV